MAKNTGLCYYKILQRFVYDSNHGRIQPIFATFVKKYGMTVPALNKMLLQYLCMEDNVDGALELINELNKNKLEVDLPVSLVGVLAEQHRSVDAYKLVMGARNSLPTMDVVDYSVVIDGLCKEGCIDKALELCHFARNKGIVLSVVTYNSVFHGLCRQSCFVEAFRLFDALESNNIAPSEVTYGTLIDGLVREGFLLDAKKFFEKMLLKGIKPNTHIFNSLIFGFCKFGNMEEALRLLHDLETRCLKPDKFTISALVYGFTLQGNMEGALHFFIDMKRKDFSPDFVGFLFLVRGLCTKGRLEEARSILREMLQDESVVDLINRVNAEIETESIVSFLLQLCEEGSIQEAVIILNEIGSMYIPCKRFAVISGLKPIISNEEHPHPISLAPSCAADQMNFDALYSRIATLCDQGDLKGANEVARCIISSIPKS